MKGHEENKQTSQNHDTKHVQKVFLVLRLLYSFINIALLGELPLPQCPTFEGRRQTEGLAGGLFGIQWRTWPMAISC